MILARKIKLSPTKEQKIVLEQMLHATKFIYNKTLFEVFNSFSEKISIIVKETSDNNISFRTREVSKGNEKYLRYYSKNLKYIKENYFLNVLSSVSVQYIAKNVKSSIDSVLKRRKEKKKARFRFKRNINEVKITFENAGNQSLRVNQGGFDWEYMKKAVKFIFPEKSKKEIKELSFIKFKKVEKHFPNNIGNKFYISKDAFGDFYLSFLYEIQEREILGEEDFIGFDIGFTDIIVNSLGEKIEAQRIKAEYIKKEAKLRKKLARKYENKLCKIKNQITKKELKRILKKNKKDKYLAKKLSCKSNLPLVDKIVYTKELFDLIKSNKLLREQNKINKLPAKSARKVDDYNHKLANTIVDMISHVGCFENLNLDGMKKLFGKRISELCIGDLIRKVEYKAKKQGKQIIKVGKFYASTKICFDCNYKLSKIGLNEREWECPECGSVHDRDINASKNIEKEGKRIKKGVPA